ncbi:GILT-like protein 1 [Glossina fuscipes]|uniref:GILT-like protein 1 n=1 Tax=Glossina fuscipes TaxID=7396 RepID=A0A9C5Z4U9_9MUSC|nr:GILT-like protein 1 [Glossina fuscipes]
MFKRVPFSKSTYTTQGSEILFTCHHSPNDYYGNKVHPCAGKNFPDNVYLGANCARETHVSTWENIQQCANSTDGERLLMAHGQTTNAFQNPLISVRTL